MTEFICYLPQGVGVCPPSPLSLPPSPSSLRKLFRFQRDGMHFWAGLTLNYWIVSYYLCKIYYYLSYYKTKSIYLIVVNYTSDIWAQQNGSNELDVYKVVFGRDETVKAMDICHFYITVLEDVCTVSENCFFLWGF